MPFIYTYTYDTGQNQRYISRDKTGTLFYLTTVASHFTSASLI